ncbi:unnamed protein product [Sphagnum jensenii]|uniref:ferroxidase n=1 Tax=Sphagnum jensenii TaxID=128206 RepID=A0ABP1BKE7_9BRYO
MVDSTSLVMTSSTMMRLPSPVMSTSMMCFSSPVMSSSPMMSASSSSAVVATPSMMPAARTPPVAVTGRAQLTEKEFHAVSGDTLDQLQEKIETFGEELDIEGFEVDYSDGVLTVQLGSKGTYVINKQTPNRQIWLSSPISGPARFDWHGLEHVWVYRRTKAQLLPLLEEELSQLMGKSITLKD